MDGHGGTRVIPLLLNIGPLELWKRQRGIYHLLDRPVMRIRIVVVDRSTFTAPLPHFCAPRNVFKLGILTKVGANDPKDEGEQDLHDNLRQVIPC